MSTFDTTENKLRFGMTFQTPRDKLAVMLLLERGLQSLGDVGPEARAVLAAVRSAIPAQEFVAEAADIMAPTSLTAKIEHRLREIGLEATVWCPQASHGAYVFQAIGAGNTTLALDKIGAYLSKCPELGPIVAERGGPHGEHLTLRLAVGGGE